MDALADESTGLEIDRLIEEGVEAHNSRAIDRMIELATRAREIIDGLPEDYPLRFDRAFEAAYLLGRAYYLTGKLDDAQNILESLVHDDRPIRRTRIRLQSLHTLALVHEQRRENDAALEYYARLRDAAEAAEDWMLVVWGCNGQGRIHISRSDLAEAARCYGEALEIAQRHGLTNQIAGMANNLGLMHMSAGDYARALEYFLLARNTWTDTVNEGVGGLLVNIGSTYQQLGELPKALEFTLEGLDACEKVGSRRFVANALVNLGSIYAELHEYDRAREFLERGLEAQIAQGDVGHQANAVAALAGLAEKQGEHDAAIDHARRAVELARSSGEPKVIAAHMLLLADLLARFDDREASVAIIRDALEIAERTDMTMEQSRAHGLLAEHYKAIGDFERALEHTTRGHELKEKYISHEAQERLKRALVLHDVETARKEAEIERLRNVELAQANEQLARTIEELKHAQSQLVHSEKMASLGQLTAGVAHEINNPVNFIRTSTSPLRRDLDEVRAIVARALEPETDEIRERVEKRMRDEDIDELRHEIDSLMRGIEEGASRTAEIVKGLRTFSRLDENELKLVDLHEGIDSTLTLLRPRLGAIEVVRNYGDIPPVECNPGQVNQVLMNLLTNAVQAIEGDGRITVTTAADDEAVTVAIEDTGSGIPESVRAKIFEPFFTTKEVGSGTGLGLSISYGIVEKHGGTISVESQEGVGTTFIVRLLRRAALE